MFLLVAAILGFAGCSDQGNEPVGPPPIHYSVTNIFWTHVVDLDQDGYASSGSLNVSVNVTGDINRIIRVRAFYKGSEETVWTYLQDKVSTVNGSVNKVFTFNGLASNLYYGSYDFRFIVSVWDGSNLVWYGDIQPPTFNALTKQKFEYDGQDANPQP